MAPKLAKDLISANDSVEAEDRALVHLLKSAGDYIRAKKESKDTGAKQQKDVEFERLPIGDSPSPTHR